MSHLKCKIAIMALLAIINNTSYADTVTLNQGVTDSTLSDFNSKIWKDMKNIDTDDKRTKKWATIAKSDTGSVYVIEAIFKAGGGGGGYLGYSVDRVDCNKNVFWFMVNNGQITLSTIKKIIQNDQMNGQDNALEIVNTYDVHVQIRKFACGK